MMAKSRNKGMVAEFHNAFRVGENEMGPTTGTEAVRELRCKLLLEEVLEFIDACGCNVMIDGLNAKASFTEITITATDRPPDLVEMADGLGDIEYVTHGAALQFGIPSETIFAEIHASNMSKLGDDGKPIVRADGKILKGPNYFKPRIARILGLPEEEN